MEYKLDSENQLKKLLSAGPSKQSGVKKRYNEIKNHKCQKFIMKIRSKNLKKMQIDMVGDV